LFGEAPLSRIPASGGRQLVIHTGSFLLALSEAGSSSRGSLSQSRYPVGQLGEIMRLGNRMLVAAPK